MKKKLPPIYFNQIKTVSDRYKTRIINKIKKVIKHGVFILGNENKKLEKNLEKIFNGGYAMTCSSGHDALLLSLLSLKLCCDDEIIFPVNSYPTAFPVFLSGAKPVPVDVDKNGQIDPKQLKDKISPKTKVVILVHLYGLVGKINEIKSLIRNKNIVLIEDCAQAFGSKYEDKFVGTLGDIGCYSFYPTKNLGTFGDGGAIWTKNKKTYEYLLKSRSYGEKTRYKSEFIAGHSRLPEIQAGILNVLLKNINWEINQRKKISDYYEDRIIKTGLTKYVKILKSDSKSKPAKHLFVVNVKNRDNLKKYLEKKAIETHIHYPYPINLIPAFRFLKYNSNNFPMAEKLSKNILSLPFHGYLKNKQIDYILESIRHFYD